MVEVVYLPRRAAEEAKRRGLDIGDLILKVLAQELKLDPEEISEARLELASRFFEEANLYLEKGEAVQASEKLYKTVEECIKALAEVFNVPQVEEVKRRGKWDTWLLGMASTDLSKTLKEDRIRLAWKDACDIHVWGFHEAKYRVEDVKAALPLTEWLLNFTRQVVAGNSGRRHDV
ncbi:MAG: PaREP1 family protein [Pyrobaculum sp.]|uniref:PaREP1 family protein n=1 Tax=Pyrobaculum sp. TaxID=2004705 RepID=UPI0031805572